MFKAKLVNQQATNYTVTLKDGRSISVTSSEDLWYIMDLLESLDYIHFDNAIVACSEVVAVLIKDICPACGGTGVLSIFYDKDFYGQEKCATCDGSGKV